MTELNTKYVMRKITIDIESIKDFNIDFNNRRKIREGHVKSLLKSLSGNIHFNAPFVVNELNGKYRLLDGNHRFDAIKLKLVTDKNFSIGVWCAVYRNLNEKQEREIYSIWNKPVPQSATDFLKAHWKTIPLGNEILKMLPVSIYPTTHKLGSKTLIGAHINSKKQRRFEGGYGAGKEQTIEDFRNLTFEDIKMIHQFTEIMKEIFGSFDSKSNSLFYKTNALPSFNRIWYDNKDIIPRKDFINIFKKVFASNVKSWENSINASGRVGCQLFYKIGLETLNSLQRKYTFLSCEDIIAKKEKQEIKE